MYDEFYQDKHILVTGVAGFKGTWLALALLEAGARVTGIDIRRPEPQSNYVAAGLADRIRFVQADVADLDAMHRAIEGVDGIFHLAAMALVGDAQRNPFEAYRSNTLGVAAVLEAIRQSAEPIRAVFVTTDKVYRPNNGEPWNETDPLVSNGAYAVSKACAEFAIADYQKQYFEGSDKLIGIGRAGNVVIGGDLHTSRKTNGSGRIFSDCYEALAEGRPPEIFTPGFTRPYTYGLDIVSGYMTLMSRLDRPGVAGEAFNFGPYEQFGISNALLATKICELWGEGIMWRSGTPRPEPLVYQSLNCRKSNEILKWRPAYTLYEALASTTRWYKSWAEHGGAPEPGSMYELDRQLIQEHRTAASNLGIDWAAQPEAVYA